MTVVAAGEIILRSKRGASPVSVNRGMHSVMNSNPQALSMLTFSLTEFTPGEVEAITTLTTAMQRDWRKRGFLPKSTKHARFDAFGVAELWVMKLLADRGIGPMQSMAIAPRCAQAVVFAALRWWDHGWRSDPSLAYDSVPDAMSHEQRLGQEWERTYPAEGRLKSRKRSGFIDPQHKRDWATEAMFKHLSIDPIRCADIIWWPNGEIEFGDLVSIGESKDLNEDRAVGFALTLSVDNISEIFLKRAGVPLASIAVQQVRSE